MARRFGPGLLLAVAGIGSSHFLLAPTAGARFGTALAWAIVLGHVIKYPAFRDATLYAARTGRSVMDGFRALPGPKGWAVAATLVLFAIQASLVIAGVSLVAAAAVVAIWPGFYPLTTLVAILGLSGVLLWTGSYRGLERFSTWALILIATLTVVAFAVARPVEVALVRDSVWPRLPEASGFLVGSLLGFMPAPLELAIMKGLWAHARGETPSEQNTREALVDFRVGYGVSAMMALMLLAMGAHFVYAQGTAAGGFAVLSNITEGFRQTLGAAAVPVVLGAAVLGMFSTVHAVADGYPRVMGAAWHGLKGTTPATGRDLTQWIVFYAVCSLSVLLVLILPDPLAVVGIAANATVLMAPFWAAVLWWTVARDPQAAGSVKEHWSSLAGVVALTLVAVVVAVVLPWGIP